jgi:hypothetical protein
MTDDEIYVRLSRELDRVYEEVNGLVWNRHVFWKIQELFRKNKSLHGKSGTFNKWMAHMYTGAMSAGIRRLVDVRKGTISFVRLLNGVKACPSCVSRSEYKARCTNPHLPEGYVDRDYDNLIGKGVDQPDRKTIDDEIAELKRLTTLLKDFVDERVAHTAKDQGVTLPTYQHLDDAIDYLDKLVRRYLHLFRGVAMRSMLPTELYDWMEVFRYPWIEESEDQKPPAT